MPPGGQRRLPAAFARTAPYLAPVILAITIGAIVAAMFASHRPGHWWGDDWALYIHQAEGLLDGRPNAVFDANRFTVEMSQGAPFSPPLYPWGFPLLLAPFIAILGSDIDRLAIVPVLCSAVFACSWYSLARPRLGKVPALVGVVAVTMTPLLFGWSELIQSEWAFLATVFVVLVGLDHLVANDGLVRRNASLIWLAVLGLGATAAFSVRREGLAIVAAIAAAQIVGLLAARAWELRGRELGDVGLRVLAPHLTALSTVLVLQWVLPSTLVPKYEGTGLGNLWKFRVHHIDHLAEVSGLKRAWDTEPMVLGSSTLGWIVVIAYFTAAAGGIVLALTKFIRRDIHLVAYVVVAFMIGASFRSALNRYVASIGPLLLLFGLVGIISAFRYFRIPRIATAVVTVLLLAIAAGNIANANVRIDRADKFDSAGRIEFGPTHPSSIEMFAYVAANSSHDAIIAAPKARAMALVVDRPTVQVDDYRAIPDGLDIALIVTTHDSELAVELLSEPAVYSVVWSNDRFKIFQPKRAESASTNGAGSSSTPSP